MSDFESTSAEQPPGEPDRRSGGMKPPPPRPDRAALDASGSLADPAPADAVAARESLSQAVARVTRECAACGVRVTPGGVATLLGGAPAPPSPQLVALLGQLQAAAGAFVRGRRAAGTPIERLLPEVKGLVRELSDGDHSARDVSDGLTAQVVRWSIEAYYDQPDLRGTHRFY